MAPKKLEEVLTKASDAQTDYTLVKTGAALAVGGVGLAALRRMMLRSRRDAKDALEYAMVGADSWTVLNDQQVMYFPYKYPHYTRAYTWLNYLAQGRGYYIAEYIMNEKLVLFSRERDQVLEDKIKRAVDFKFVENSTYRSRDKMPQLILLEDIMTNGAPAPTQAQVPGAFPVIGTSPVTAAPPAPVILTPKAFQYNLVSLSHRDPAQFLFNALDPDNSVDGIYNRVTNWLKGNTF